MAFATRLPPGDWWLSNYLACGTALITAAIVASHSKASPYALVYVWVGFDAFFFLNRRAAFGHLLFAALAYAVALGLTPGDGDPQAVRWLMTMGTVLVIGLLADVLRERSERLIARLGDAARTDPLTGLLNRRGFEEQMADELERARRGHATLSLIVGDLDHFKLVNDRFGHHRGDETLVRFSRLRRGDQARHRRRGAHRRRGVRADPPAHRRARRLPDGRAPAPPRPRPLRAGGPQISMSLGVATFPAHGETAEDLLRCADQAMYLAKRLGRDRSVIFSAEVTTSFNAAAESPSNGVEQLPAVLTLAETLDLRDIGTALHSQTVGRFAEAIATELGLPAERVERIRLAGLLHDIGKLGVPDPVLRKTGGLDDAEWAEMRKHPELGARILASANLDDISGWVLAHHERPDGRGYPAGLALADIPLEARILSVADSFEAMTSDRVYRAAMTIADGLDELRRCAGSQFDTARGRGVHPQRRAHVRAGRRSGSGLGAAVRRVGLRPGPRAGRCPSTGCRPWRRRGRARRGTGRPPRTPGTARRSRTPTAGR